MAFGARNSSVPRYVRQFQSIGVTDSEKLWRRGVSAAVAGAQGGVAGALFSGIGEVGKRLIEKGHSERIAEVTKAAGEKGLAAGEKAALEGISVKLREDDTLAAKAFNESLQAGYLARMDVIVQDKAAQMAQEHATDPQGFNARWASMREEVLGAMPKEWRRDVDLELERRRVRLIQPISAATVAEVQGEANADLLTASDRYAGAAARDWREGRPDAAMENAGRYELFLDKRTDMTPQQKEAAKLALRRDGRKQAVLGEFERTAANGLDAAERFVADFDGGKWQIVDPDEKDALGRALGARLNDMKVADGRAKAEADAEASAYRARTIADLDLRISRGQAGYAELDDARAAGMFDRDPGRYTTLAKAIDKRGEEDRKRAENVALVNGALMGDTVLDPGDAGHRKAADDAYSAWADQEAVGALAPEVRNAAAADFVSRTGIVPARMASEIRTGLRGTAELQVAAADLVSRIELLGGEKLTGIGERTMAKARLIDSMVRAGIKPEDAVGRAAELTDPTKRAAIEAREVAFKDLEPITTAQVADLFDGWLPWEWDPAVPDMEAVALAEDVNGLFKRQYLLTGDETLARDYAKRKIRNTWGVTNTDGMARLMKYPPEAFYSIGGDDDWMHSQLLADLHGLGLPEKTDPTDIVLEADERTAREASAGKPTYSVLVRNAEGLFEPFTTDQGVVRWAPDAAGAKDDRTRRKLAKAKAKRQAMGAMRQWDAEGVFLPPPAEMARLRAEKEARDAGGL